MASAETPTPPDDEPRTNVFLESRYRKLKRGIPQTVFHCPRCRGHARRRKKCRVCDGFGKLTRTSVQELIERRLRPTMRAKRTVFHGAGREDLDVLMLGRGRPFVVEVVGARAPNIDLVALRDEIVDRSGGALDLDPFVTVTRERVAYWKQGVFSKEYRVEAALSEAVSDDAVAALVGQELQLMQRTPQRVSQNRADLVRERQVIVQAVTRIEPSIEEMPVEAEPFAVESRTDASVSPDSRIAEPVPEQPPFPEIERLELKLQCEHGTYVKEWVSGDDNRTKPSLAELLGVSARCAVLDVEEILTD